MRKWSRTFLVLPSLSSSFALVAQSEATLKYKAMPAFDLILPDEKWNDGANGIAIPHRGGDRFATEVDLMSTRIDADGDGKCEVTAKGLHGHVLLHGKKPDGSALNYAIRVRNSGNRCEYATSGAMVGAIEGVPIQLIDQNCNGIYNEVGVDAMVVGQGKAAAFLSKVVNLEGKLFEITVDAAGATVKTMPFVGPSGRLNVRRGVKILGDLHAAVVSDATNTMSFEVAGAADGVRVPVGNYKFSGGFASKGGDTARLRAGKMKSLVVEENGTATLQWGAPLVAEFDFVRAGDQVTVQPNVMFVGRGGEEWHTLLPDAKSPKLMFLDKDADKLIATKRFEGC